MAYGEDEHEGSKQRWINDTHEARRNAMEIRRQIPPEATDTPPIDVPEYVDFYNRLVHEYAAQLQPKAGELGEDYWEEDLTTVEVPKSGARVDLGRVELDREGLDGAVYQAPTEPRTIRLSTLHRDWVEDGSVTVTVAGRDPWSGDFERAVTKRLYLPVRAADRVVQQCNACLNWLGWLPKAAVVEYRAGPDEVLTHE